MNPEWEIFSKAQKGDRDAWFELASNHQPRLISLAYLITGSINAAEDIVQETFIRGLNAQISNNNGTVKGYLGTITYRLAVKELKRSQRNERLTPEIKDNSDDMLDGLIKNEQKVAAAKAIRQLDSKHREVLLLRFYAGNSYSEIASLLGISLGTVKSRIFYAVKQCRDILKEDGIIE